MGYCCLSTKQAYFLKSCQGLLSFTNYLTFLYNPPLKEKLAQEPLNTWKMQEEMLRMQRIFLFFLSDGWLFLHNLLASSTNENNCFGVHACLSKRAINLTAKTVTNVKCHLARQFHLITYTDLFLSYKNSMLLGRIIFSPSPNKHN